MRKRGYGHILKLTIDPKAGSLDTEVLLKGEAEPLSLHLDYRVGTGGKPSLTILSLRCSRPWMEALARDFLLKKEIPLPGRAAALLRDLLG
jgi:hypothetical protein